MNSQHPRSSYRLATMLIASFLIPSMAFGAGAGIVVPPRVIVVFDSSSSMAATPDGTDLRNMEDPGGDYDVNDPTAPCDSKFCLAKKVMSNVVPGFSGDVRLGLAHYYQFIAKYTSQNTQYTRCYYDQMYAPGVPLTWTTATDLGATTTGFPASLSGRCVNNAAHQYTSTKIATNTTATFRCADYSYPGASTKNWGNTPPTSTSGNTRVQGGASACQANQSYTQIAGPVQWNTPLAGATNLSNPPSNYVRQAIGPGGTSCPAAVPFAGMPGGPPSRTLTSLTASDIGTSVGDWQGMTVGECTTSAPCHLYSVSATFTQLTQNQSHFGLYTTAAFTPANPANTITATHTDIGTVCTGNNCTSGWTGWSNNMCYPTGTYTSTRRWGDFGFPSTSSNPPFARPVGFTENTPGRTNPTCSPGQPCYVTLVQQQTQTLPGTPFTVYNPSPNPSATIPAGSSISGPTTPATTYQRLVSAGCPGTLSNQTNGSAFRAGFQPTGCSSADNMDCTFNLVNNNFMVANGCASPVTRRDGNSQPNCNSAIGTFTYTGGATSTFNSVVTLAPGSNCGSLPNVGSQVAAGSNGCPAGGTSCLLQNKVQGTGSAVTSYTWTNSGGPSGYSGPTPSPWGSETRDTNSARLNVANPSCPAAGTAVAASGAMCGSAGSPCTVLSTGRKPDQKAGENQLYTCFYQPQRWAWTGTQVTCTMTYPSRSWTTATSGPVCTYTRRQWTVTPPGPTQYRCRYSAPASRHDYTINGNRFCEYYRTRSIYELNTYLYTYQYDTKGGELVSERPGGTWMGDYTLTPPTAAMLCDTPYNDLTGFTPGGECPPRINNCGGNPNTYCMLRWGRPSNSGGSDRYQWALTENSSRCIGYDQHPSGTNTPAASNLVSNNKVTGSTPSATTVCLQAGAAPVDEFRLVSDWYDPALPPNAIVTSPPAPAGTETMSATPSYTTHIPPLTMGGNWSVSAWSNQTSKLSGMSVAFSADGGATPSQIFLEVGADSPAPSATGILNAFDKCELPNASNIDPVTLKWTPKGICFAQDNYKNSAGKADFTPLFGSLKNAKEYVQLLRAADDPSKDACRKYYVVLVTDGKEDTPRNATQADLLSAVDELCGSKDSNGKCVDTSTFVVAFGNSVAADLPTMDLMADRGGTGAAYPSSDPVALELALTNVFSSITAGSFSRSKPSLSTDGTRLYASSFTKCGGTLATGLKGCVASDGVTPDPKQNGMWKGFMDTYLLSSSGLIHKWELSNKMNLQSPPRNILVSPLAGCTTPPCAGDPFDNSNVALLAAIAPAGSPSAAQLPPQAIVDWVHNDSLSTPFYYDHTGPMPGNTALRTSRVHDIQHSQAVVVGKSVFGVDWGGSSPTQRTEYSLFQSSTISRPTRILVGTNDGVLHGIKERDPAAICSTNENDPSCPNGQEAWAWVPSDQISGSGNGLYRHLQGHRLGVDGTPTVADICGTVSGGISSNAASCTAADWKTVALITGREGGTRVTALQLSNSGGPPQFLWDYQNPAYLGQTWSTPAIGRVLVGGQEKFIALFGGGRNVQPNGALPIVSGSSIGEAIITVDALSGQEYRVFSGGDITTDIPARPSIYRRPLSSFIDTAVIGTTGGDLKVVRFADPAGNTFSDSANWRQHTFFDPLRNRDRIDINGQTTKIRTVVRTPAWDVPLAPTDVPTYVVQHVNAACGTSTVCPNGEMNLPLSSSPPVYNRAKAVPNGNGAAADYFVGTGDAAAVETGSSIDVNYFYALRDRNTQNPGSSNQNDGQPIFVIRLPRKQEQIVSEAATINGAVIVLSYTPPQAGGCGNEGDTTVYAFDPNSGDLTPALVDPNAGVPLPDGGVAGPDAGVGGSGSGAPTSVVECRGCGIPSDPIIVDNQLYFNTTSGLKNAGVRPRPNIGDIRSFRRIR